ncbi:hypothetical protein Nepgr_017331 [Nepenthes gracilis]|uniref:Uncharacterized protein n=1 Tax=Nepenthes gracilis TaxID=150966 RepID=A0AAD3SR87_NEPGR|nr:hypothetical protein Nepgr_017331 [Nepenthes gracilis]
MFRKVNGVIVQNWKRRGVQPIDMVPSQKDKACGVIVRGAMVPIYYGIIALLCSIGAIALAMFHIYRPLMNYMEPTYQRHIVQIIFMVPVFTLMSFLSLILPRSSIYFNFLHEIEKRLRLSGGRWCWTWCNMGLVGGGGD